VRAVTSRRNERGQRASRALTVVAVVTATGCAVVPGPTPGRPRVSWRSQDVAVRQRVYDEFRLEVRRCRGGASLARSDGVYTHDQLRQVLSEYPRSRALSEAADWRIRILLNAGIAGVVALGAAGGDHLFSAVDGGSGRLGGDGRIALYTAGAALVGAALVGAWLWRDPVPDIPATYNDELRADLGLDGADMAGATAVAATCPRR
jgi:hypothetical protein